MKRYSKKTIITSFLILSSLLIFCASTLAYQEIRVYDYLGGLKEEAPREIIVKYKQSTQPVQIKSFSQTYGISQTNQDYLATQYSGVYIYPIKQIGQISQFVAAFSQEDMVAYAEPNYIYHALAESNDPYYPYQWHIDNPAYGGIHTANAWDIQTGKTDVIVAVIDTGVAYEDYGAYKKAPDLVNTNFVQGYDFVGADNHPNDDNAHGTHVTGTIAQSTNNSLGTTGVAYNVSIMPIKVLDSNGSGTVAAIAEGIYYAADHGADIINLSLGGSEPSNTLKDACEYAYNKGVTIVAASGNLGINQVSYPAAYDDYVIAVGATRYDETRSPYSNYGASLDIMGPGGDTDEDQNADGYGDGVLQNTINPQTKDPTDFGYWFLQGTSMAAPHVTGVAALLSANGVTGPDNIRNTLTSTAEDLGPAGWDEEYGYGLVDALAALRTSPEKECLDTSSSTQTKQGGLNIIGSVGIGTTSPTEKLEVAGIIKSASGGFKFPDGTVQTTAASGGGAGDGHSLDAADGSPVDAVYVDNSGRVGIGTKSPKQKLSIAKGAIDLQSDGVGKGEIAMYVSGAEALWYNGTYFSWGYGGKANYFADKVGIGTTNPDEKLHVEGDMTVKSSMPTIYLKTSSGISGFLQGTGTGSTNTFRVGTMSDNSLSFYTKNSAKMVIEKNGNVGIGTTDPRAKLDIVGPGYPNSFIFLDATGGNEDAGLRIYRKGSVKWHIFNHADGSNNRLTIYNSNASQYVFTATQAGNVGIGTRNPSYKLHVQGTAYATGAAGALSDLRHKRNINDLSLDALEVIKKLRPVRFEWKEPQDSGMEGEQLGFIAQEVEQVLSEAVLTQENDEQTKGLKYNALIPLLTKAIQELEAKNKALIQEIEQIKEAVGL